MSSIVTPVTVIHEDSEQFDNEETLQTENTEDDKEVIVGQQATKAVSLLRWVVFGVLLVVALLVCLGVYTYAKESEVSIFESEFEAYAARLVDSFEQGATRRLKSMQSLSVAYTAHAQELNMTWPFVTLNEFEIRASLALDLADAVCVLLLPLVPNDDRQKWLQYSQAHQGWLLDGLLVQAGNNVTKMKEIIVDDITALQNISPSEEIDEDEVPATYATSTINPEIIRFVDNETMASVRIEDRPGPWFPIWQFAPSIFIPNFVNVNSFETETEYMLKHTEMFISASGTEGDSGESGFLDIFLRRWDDRYEGGPVSNLFVPVFQSNLEEENVLVGVLNTFIYWSLYFEDVLPDKAYGVIVVLENTLNQMYSFEINGPHVTYLGPGDSHDNKYDYLEKKTEFGSFIGSFGNSTPVEERLCSYRIRIYPSNRMKSEYMTTLPTEIAAVLAITFLFTLFVFFTYDCLVERRQEIVLSEAIKTGNVVNSLFPDNVRDRLYDNEQVVVEETKGKARNSISTRMSINSSRSTSGGNGRSGSKPIADLYPNCTVLFADIKGFTKWSSQREPADVFILLETIYGSFDRSAKRLSVCKIETIGDCYLAVTGLPRPQDDHAERMARFAVLLNTKMNQIAQSLICDLGSDTVNLQMRIGLHSGPVTAGVLRGEKARFQLFGDTVNTASRMESTGEGSKIQLSQETADLLIAAGKSKWIEPRDTLIEAKGKGSLQTYWLKKGDVFSSAHDSNSISFSTMDDSYVVRSDTTPSSRILDGKAGQEETLPARVSPLETTGSPAFVRSDVSDRSLAV